MVAGFIGSVNMFEGAVTGCSDALTTVAVPKLGITVTAKPDRRRSAGQAITVGIRPEKIAISREEPAGARNCVARARA